MGVEAWGVRRRARHLRVVQVGIGGRPPSQMPGIVISAGLCGGLLPDQTPGTVVIPSVVAFLASDRAAFVKGLQDEYRDDIDIFRLASELIVDAVVPPAELRAELVRRFGAYRSRRRADVSRHHPVPPV